MCNDDSPPAAVKDRPLLVPLTAEDRQILDEAADTERLPTSSWVRMIALREAKQALAAKAAGA